MHGRTNKSLEHFSCQCPPPHPLRPLQLDVHRREASGKEKSREGQRTRPASSGENTRLLTGDLTRWLGARSGPGAPSAAAANGRRGQISGAATPSGTHARTSALGGGRESRPSSFTQTRGESAWRPRSPRSRPCRPRGARRLTRMCSVFRFALSLLPPPLHRRSLHVPPCVLWLSGVCPRKTTHHPRDRCAMGSRPAQPRSFCAPSGRGELHIRHTRIWRLRIPAPWRGAGGALLFYGLGRRRLARAPCFLSARVGEVRTRLRAVVCRRRRRGRGRRKGRNKVRRSCPMGIYGSGRWAPGRSCGRARRGSAGRRPPSGSFRSFFVPPPYLVAGRDRVGVDRGWGEGRGGGGPGGGGGGRGGGGGGVQKGLCLSPPLPLYIR